MGFLAKDGLKAKGPVLPGWTFFVEAPSLSMAMDMIFRS